MRVGRSWACSRFFLPAQKTDNGFECQTAAPPPSPRTRRGLPWLQCSRACDVDRRHIAVIVGIRAIDRRFEAGGGENPGETRLRHRLASLVIASVIGLASILPARAQAPYPSHPIRIVVP